MRNTAEYTWTDHTTNTEIAKELNIIPVFDKIQAYRRHWLQHINRIPQNRLPRILKKKLPTSRQKKPGVTIKETSRCVRLERVNNWPHTMLAREW